MLGSLVFGPDKELADLLYRRCSELADLSIYRILNEYPKLHHLVRLLNAYSPHIIFLELGQDPEAWEVAHNTLADRPDVTVIGFTRGDKLKDAPEGSGIAEIIQEPINADTIRQAISRALEKQGSSSGDNVLAFLPAKAGSGASTTALNTAGALVHYWKQKVLILEADLHSGCLPIQLKLDPDLSIVDALENAESLTERQWRRLTSRAQEIDLLLTSRNKKPAIVGGWDYQQLLSFASPHYDTIIVDLPEVINDATEAVVRRAQKVYVVCTPELPSLFLARRRLLELAKRGVNEDRLDVVLNRYGEIFESVQEIEELLGRKTAAVVPNDYLTMRSASLGSGLIEEGSSLLRTYCSFAQSWTGSDPVVPPPEEGAAAATRMGSMKSFFSENLRGLLGRSPGKSIH